MSCYSIPLYAIDDPPLTGCSQVEVEPVFEDDEPAEAGEEGAEEEVEEVEAEGQSEDAEAHDEL